MAENIELLLENLERTTEAHVEASRWFYDELGAICERQDDALFESLRPKLEKMAQTYTGLAERIHRLLEDE